MKGKKYIKGFMEKSDDTFFKKAIVVSVICACFWVLFTVLAYHLSGIKGIIIWAGMITFGTLILIYIMLLRVWKKLNTIRKLLNEKEKDYLKNWTI